MAKKSVNRIGSIFNYQEHQSTYVKVEDILDTPLTLLSYITKKGNMGEYAIMTCINNATGETIDISCGATMVMKALNAITPRDLPIAFQFEQLGRAYVMADTPDTAE